MIQAINQPKSKTINTFEEYTLYSLERSVPALLRMMERSKHVAAVWPDITALIAAAELCQEIAALADFQNSLQQTLGETGDESDRKREGARNQLIWIMDSMEDALNMNDPEVAKRLFAVDLPGALNEFMDAVPSVCRHIREHFIQEGEGAEHEGVDKELA